MTRYLDCLTLPTTTDHATRLAWAGDRIWDLVEGQLTKDQAHWLVNVLIGWSDMGTEAERESYRILAGQASELIG